MPPLSVSETEITKVLSQYSFSDDMRKYHHIANIRYGLGVARQRICCN